jgi:GntR family transcriptional repressor for pyruvate dehydrogenase complex
VSRSIIREAYRSLSSAGIVDVANGRLPRVGRISHRALTQILQHALSTDQASATDILELRASIEERAAELAAKRRTVRDVEDLRRAVELMRSAGRQADRYVRGDLAFHETIARAAGNPLFALVCTALRESIGMSIRVSLRGRRSRRELSDVADAHEAIVAAIDAGKGAQARKLMVLHFEDARAAVLRLLDVGEETRSGRSTTR